MQSSLHTAFIDLLSNQTLSDAEIRRLVGWYALSLADLLRRKCVTVRYAERMLFNLDVVQKLEQRHLQDCVELVDWGMQLEDWEEHTPKRLKEAIDTIAQLAQRLLTPNSSSATAFTKSAKSRIARHSSHA
jgi:ADP-dependent phosphofructokinase/glucokinase